MIVIFLRLKTLKMETPSTSGVRIRRNKTPRNKNTLVNLDTPKAKKILLAQKNDKPSKPRKVPVRSCYSNTSKKLIRKSTWKKVQEQESL